MQHALGGKMLKIGPFVFGTASEIHSNVDELLAYTGTSIAAQVNAVARRRDTKMKSAENWRVRGNDRLEKAGQNYQKSVNAAKVVFDTQTGIAKDELGKAAATEAEADKMSEILSIFNR